MIIKMLPLKSRLLQFWNLFANWLERHWIKVLAVSFCIFLALERNLTLDLHLSTSRPAVKVSRHNAPGLATKTSNQSPAPRAQLTAHSVPDQKRKAQLQYVQRFAKVAQIEQEKFGIPASIKLAQGVLESQAGKSPLATQNNNHFGIKCFSRKCRKGHCRNFKDDSHKDFFRIYPSAWESYRNHSLLLKNEERYQALFNHPTDDYRSWAYGLAKAGYATDKQYADKLIGLIEALGLDQYDG